MPLSVSFVIPMSLKDSLLSVYVFVILGLWALLLMPLGWFIWLAYKLMGRKVTRVARIAAWIVGHSSLRLLWPFVRVKVKNPEETVKNRPCIIVINHQSFLDLYLCSMHSETRLCVLTKSWPFRLLFPFTGVMRAAEYIEIEHESADYMLEACRKELRLGESLLVFPEGRRSRTGKLGRFHSGIFKLALEEQVPIVPMVIKNSYEIVRPETCIVHSGCIDVEFLPAVSPEQYGPFLTTPLPHRALLKYVRGLFIEHLPSRHV